MPEKERNGARQNTEDITDDNNNNNNDEKKEII
jgi:hypothetical protein